MNLDQFPHVVLLKQSEIKFKELDEVVKLNIESFEKSFKTWQTKKDPGMLSQLKARSQMIAQHIWNYFVEEEEQTAQEGDIAAMAEDIKNANENTATGNNSTIPAKNPGAPGSQTGAPEANAKPLSKDEQALKNLFEKGIVTSITLDMLNKEGFNIGMSSKLGRRGCVVGNYELVRMDSSTYNLKKI